MERKPSVSPVSTKDILLAHSALVVKAAGNCARRLGNPDKLWGIAWRVTTATGVLGGITAATHQPVPQNSELVQPAPEFATIYDQSVGLSSTATPGMLEKFAKAVVNAPVAEAAVICEAPPLETINASFRFEVKYHTAEGQPLPKGTKIFIVYQPEIVNKNAVPEGRTAIGEINGTDNVVLDKQDPRQIVKYTKTDNSHEVPQKLTAPRNTEVYDKSCNFNRPAIEVWVFNSLGYIDGREVLTNDPQPIRFRDRTQNGSDPVSNAFFNKQPETIATGTPAPTATPVEVRLTPTPTLQPVRPPQQLPNTGPQSDKDSFNEGYCVAVNEARGNPPSAACPDDVNLLR